MTHERSGGAENQHAMFTIPVVDYTEAHYVGSDGLEHKQHTFRVERGRVLTVDAERVGSGESVVIIGTAMWHNDGAPQLVDGAVIVTAWELRRQWWEVAIGRAAMMQVVMNRAATEVADLQAMYDVPTDPGVS